MESISHLEKMARTSTKSENPIVHAPAVRIVEILSAWEVWRALKRLELCLFRALQTSRVNINIVNISTYSR